MRVTLASDAAAHASVASTHQHQRSITMRAMTCDVMARGPPDQGPHRAFRPLIPFAVCRLAVGVIEKWPIDCPKIRRGGRLRGRAAALIADHNRRGVNLFREETMDRAEVRQSVAFQALTPVGRRVLPKIEDEVARNGGGAVALPRSSFGGSLGSVTFGVRQCERLGFVSVHVHAGLRRAHTFRLCDDWKSISADKAARLVKLAKLPRPPQVAAPQPVKPPKPHRHRSQSRHRAPCSNAG